MARFGKHRLPFTLMEPNRASTKLTGLLKQRSCRFLELNWRMDCCLMYLWPNSIRGSNRKLRCKRINGKGVWVSIQTMLLTKSELQQHNWSRRMNQGPAEKWCVPTSKRVYRSSAKVLRRVQYDVCYVYKFFFSILLVRVFTCWKQLFCFRRAGFDVAFLIRRRSQGPTTT